MMGDGLAELTTTPPCTMHSCTHVPMPREIAVERPLMRHSCCVTSPSFIPRMPCLSWRTRCVWLPIGACEAYSIKMQNQSLEDEDSASSLLDGSKRLLPGNG